MSDASHRPTVHGQRLAPTLTEVIEVWESGSVPLDGQRAETTVLMESFRGRWDTRVDTAVASHTVNAKADLPRPEVAAPNEEQVMQRVLLDLQRQIDLMLEYRLREALMPALTRATDAFVLEARNELASTLRAVVSKAVAQELARLRKP